MTREQTIAHALRAIADTLEMMSAPVVPPPAATTGAGWMTTKQLSAAVGLTVQRISTMNGYPGCPVVKVGSKCLYDLAEYQQWLKDGGPAEGKRLLTEQVRAVHG